jgi:hypothetical protein
MNPNVDGNNSMYDLCSIINHLGQSIGLGHYTAFSRTHEKNETINDELGWRLFDDQHVLKVQNENEIVSKDAYVLMYRLRSSKQLDEEAASAAAAEKAEATNAETEEEESVLDATDYDSRTSVAPSEDEYYDIDSDES